VAAPTAGLHFTENVFEKLATKNISHDFVTLHVGAGTFKPVKSETLGEHEMHAEFIDVKRELISRIANTDSTIVVVGTTSLRTLESLYWMGVKTLVNPQLSMESIALQQWDAYELPQSYSKKEAFLALESWMKNNNLERLITKTQLLIAPGYDIRTVNGILTNFHQPQSTLLLLIHAFVGDEWKTIYDYALANNYRFLSYGDGSLLWKSR
jgi:S-adenosylmethionine:tRNA ribosyltransferase-isomerase